MTYVGRVVPASEYQVAAAVPGHVMRLAVEPGAVVKKGDILAELDDRRARAEYERAAAKLQVARATVERIQSLLRAASGDRHTLDEAVAGLKVAEADMALARLNLDGTKVVAPADGTVLAWHVTVGSAVEPKSGRLCDLADLRHLEAVVDVAQADVPKVSRGQRCVIQSLGADTKYKGAVRLIDPVQDPTTGTVRIRVSIERPETDDGLRPGSAVRVSIEGTK
jgi:RND family efflux transporter MFP subunit